MNRETYKIEIAAEFAERFASWTRVRDLHADWFRVVTHDDGTAEVFFSTGDQPPTTGRYA